MLLSIAGVVTLILASRLGNDPDTKLMKILYRVIGFGLLILTLNFVHVRDGLALAGYGCAFLGHYDAASILLALYHAFALAGAGNTSETIIFRGLLSVATLFGVSVGRTTESISHT